MSKEKYVEESLDEKFSNDKKFGLFLVISGIIAWIASGILTLERLALYENPLHVTSCDVNPWVSCGTVMKTEQAELLGFPNPLLGIVGFGIIICIGMTLLAGAKFARWFWIGLQVGVTVAMIFIIWLISQALYDIGILCLYCMVVWAVMIPMFILTTSQNFKNKTFRIPEKFSNFFNEWSIAISIVLVVLVASLVVVRFPQAFF